MTALSGLGIRGFGVQGSVPFVKCFFRVEGSEGTFSERKGLQKEWKPFSKDPTGGFLSLGFEWLSEEVGWVAGLYP